MRRLPLLVALLLAGCTQAPPPSSERVVLVNDERITLEGEKALVGTFGLPDEGTLVDFDVRRLDGSSFTVCVLSSKEADSFQRGEAYYGYGCHQGVYSATDQVQVGPGQYRLGVSCTGPRCVLAITLGVQH